MPEIPSIKVLEAINPANSGTGEETLVYEGLASAIEKYRPTNAQRSDAVWDAEPGSLEELSKAKQLASEYLLRTSEKAIGSSAVNTDLWANRFTLATSELYGEPDKAEATRLIANEYSFLLGLKGNSNVSQPNVQLLLDTYKPIVDAKLEEEPRADAEQEKVAIKEYGVVMLEQYQTLFDLVDGAHKHDFTSQDLQELFTEALDWLKTNDDQEWSDWEVVFSDSTQLSVEASNKKIKIGSRRESASPADTRGLIAHELLIHASRAKNGYKTGDKMLATGLAGYLDAEEGLGILAEEAVNGVLPDKAYDRYVDIALALGSVDGIQRTRQELFQTSYARQLVRAQCKGDSEEKVATLVPRVWGHVDRIYRGGRGDNIGSRQAIFTKDIAYYVGYKQMAEYITAQLAQGKSANEVFAYLSQAKFDPTNPKHLKKLAEVDNK
ncbi:MAG: hypothetical protein NVS1B10_02820 [Candidatus Saccharimonadales bacterium]